MSEEELKRLRLRRMRELLKRLALREGGEEAGEVEGRRAPGRWRPVKVTDADFDKFIRSHKLVVVDFWAPWCPPCRVLAPILEELAREFAGEIRFGKLNVDENPRTAVRFRITGIPTLLVFRHGSLVDRIIGARPKEWLEARLKRLVRPSRG